MTLRMRLSDTARYNLSPVVLYQDIHSETPPSKIGQFFIHIRLKDYAMEFIRNPKRKDTDYPDILNSISAWNQKEDIVRRKVLEYYKTQPTPQLCHGWERVENVTDIWYLSPDGVKFWYEAPRKAILTRPPRLMNPNMN